MELANAFMDRLRKGEVLFGVVNTYPAAGIVEGMCRGWDFMWIDAQHGEISYDSAMESLRAAAAVGIDAIVRVPGHEPGIIGPYADLAPCALMVPMVDTAEQARAIVRAARFPPLGMRSYGGRRAVDLCGRDYYKQRELGLIVQVETKESASNAQAIIETQGVDVLFFGPDDMKVQMGLPVGTQLRENAEMREAMAKTAGAAKAAGKFAGCIAADGPTAAMAVEMGYQILVGGADASFLRAASSQRLQELQKAVKGKTEAAAKPPGGSGIYTG